MNRFVRLYRVSLLFFYFKFFHSTNILCSDAYIKQFPYKRLLFFFSVFDTCVLAACEFYISVALFTCCYWGLAPRVAPLYNCDYLAADVLWLSAKRLFSSYFTICFVGGQRNNLSYSKRRTWIYHILKHSARKMSIIT